MEFSFSESKNKIITITVFAVAMGFLEAIVVVYLRELYYPDGFFFPMKLIPAKIYFTEIIREVTTIVMLITIGVIAGRSKVEKFAYFIFAFGIWDIFYYAALKLLLNWPSSFLTWDILFLIPVPWVGPVLAPIICSIGMVLLAFVIFGFENSSNAFKLNFFEWMLMIGGTLIILVTFIWDYSVMIIDGGFLGKYFSLMNNKDFLKLSLNYIPQSFNWFLFFSGIALILSSTISFIFRMKNKKRF